MQRTVEESMRIVGGQLRTARGQLKDSKRIVGGQQEDSWSTARGQLEVN